MTAPHAITDDGLLRLKQIIGDQKHGIPAILPISKTAFYRGIREGVFPAPIKLTPRTAVWRVSDIRALLAKV